MVDKVIELLKSMGYEYSVDDAFLLEFCVDKVVTDFKSRCHTKTLPEGLEDSAVQRACGEFLATLKATGHLEEFNIEQAVSSIKLGDTSVSYGGTSPEADFENLLTRLRNSGEELIRCFRKIQF